MIKIRQAHWDDIDCLNQLIVLSASELSRDDYSKEEIESAITYIFGVDNELILDGTYYVIEKEGVIAGCGGWSKRKTLFGGNQFAGREEYAYLDPVKDPAKIRAFFIHPKFARQGLGRLLLSYCEQKAIASGFKSFEMMATLPGVKLYQQESYIKDSNELVKLPNKVSVPFIRMKKNLDLRVSP